MEISGSKLADLLKKELKKEIKRLKKKKLKLATFLVGQSADQLSFVKIKKKLAKDLGIDFEFLHLKTVPPFERFMRKIREKAMEKETTGVIIQQPLPAHLSTNSIYNCIPITKEIEGHVRKTPYYPPIGLAILTILKYVFLKTRSAKDLFIDPKKDKNFFKKILHNKKVVLIGQGLTGGQPIGKTLTEFKVNYLGLNSRTPEPEGYLKEADIIISAVGKKVILPENLKPGVILINVGLRRENGRLKGDYEEKEINKIASFYTPVIGGIGPLDVLYLYKNLVDAVKLQ
jgi:methylenetetrahydrofolate dehydrogenase (NADP+)/methenyltetrahydrofolate cyclohydrolase